MKAHDIVPAAPQLHDDLWLSAHLARKAGAGPGGKPCGQDRHLEEQEGVANGKEVLFLTARLRCEAC